MYSLFIDKATKSDVFVSVSNAVRLKFELAIEHCVTCCVNHNIHQTGQNFGFCGV